MMTIKTYQQALDFLYSFVDYSLTRNLRYSPEKFNLDRMKHFMNDLGNPQRDYPIVHVAGTKGKGSTCAMITSILTEAGYRVGFYSSPHMVEFTERIKIGEDEISQQKLAEIVDEIQGLIIKSGNLTTFEITTALAFLYFKIEKVDVAVIEVGMGGRLDATNIIDPIISVITSISHDHTKFLGNTLEKIALEKAGIIKPNKPVIIGPQKEKVRQIINRAAIDKMGIPICVRTNYDFKIISHNLSGQKVLIRKKIPKNESSNVELKPVEIKLPLLGRHQVDNAITAYCVIEEFIKSGFIISQDSVQRGYEKVSWPGRFEIISQEPLVVIDSAHNPDSFRKLKTTISDYITDQKINFIFAASEDKAIKHMLEIIKPKIDQLIVTETSHPRAARINDIVKIAEEVGYENIKFGEFEDMINFALNSTDKNKVLIGAGSIFLSAAIREKLMS